MILLSQPLCLGIMSQKMFYFTKIVYYVCGQQLLQVQGQTDYSSILRFKFQSLASLALCRLGNA